MASLPNFNALLVEGYNTGREMKRQEGERSALAGLVSGDQSQLGNLATYNPKMAYEYKVHQDEQAAKLDELKQKKLAEGQKLVGQAALIVAQHPESQRPAAWDAQIDALVQQGWTGMAQYRGKYSPQALESVIAQGGLANEYRQGQRPRIVTPQPGGGAFGIGPSGEVSTLIAPNPGDKPFGAPVQQAPAPKIIPQRPPNMSDADLIAQAREAIRQGAPATEVFQQLQAWGVNP